MKNHRYRVKAQEVAWMRFKKVYCFVYHTIHFTTNTKGKC